MPKEVLLEAKRISKRFPGVLALDQVNFQLDYGTVHSICGENGAGKSTLMKILMGVYRRDGGDIRLRGKPVDFSSPKQALYNGIAIIEQELNPISDMTVAENMLLGREPVRMGYFINYKELNKRAAEVLSRLNLDIAPDRKMKHLSLAEVQLVEIAKAISHDSDVLIMDEPTSALGEKEVQQLFEVIEKLKSQDKGIIYVSHKLDEVFAITDKITVLRDGRYIATKNAEEIDRPELIRLMIGRAMEEASIKKGGAAGTEVLRVENLSRQNHFKDVSFSLHQGEVLGIFGLMGSGRSDFLDALFGVTVSDRGDVYVSGTKVRVKSPADAIRLGLAYVTEDRKEKGLVLTSPVKENISLASLKALSRLFFIDRKQETEKVSTMIRNFRVKIASLKQLVQNLSGGNQQKVVLSRWLLTEPRIILSDEPTRGIDIGAKEEIYKFISDYAQKGAAMIVVSSELPEIMRISDRILVFKQGTVVAEVQTAGAHEDDIIKLAS